MNQNEHLKTGINLPDGEASEVQKAASEFTLTA